MSGGTSLIRARTPSHGVKDLQADDNQILKIVQCDENGEVMGDGTPLKIVQVDEDGNIIGGTTNPQQVTMVPLVVKESFDEGDLSTGVYTATATGYGDVMGFGIYNNSATNIVTFTINSIVIPVATGKSFYGLFEYFTTVTIAGTSPDFDAFIEG